MIRVSILGYGNLGRALEDQIMCTSNIKLVAIFSRRDLTLSDKGNPIYHKDNVEKFKNKIDLLILCSGSQSDLTTDAQRYSAMFNTINTFDTHSNILSLYKTLDCICKKHNTLSIISTGWDPGLFSIEKCIFYNILHTQCKCFWGKGVSLGHSQAVRQIDGVIDAVSFTIPNKSKMKKAYRGENTDNNHLRKVYVASKDKCLNLKIANKIKGIPHYFKGQNTVVKFVNKTTLKLLKSNKHKGNLICSTKQDKIWLKVEMKNNAKFTAKIVLMYINAFKKILKKYSTGAYTPLHFSPMDISCFSEENSIKKFC